MGLLLFENLYNSGVDRITLSNNQQTETYAIQNGIQREQCAEIMLREIGLM